MLINGTILAVGLSANGPSVERIDGTYMLAGVNNDGNAQMATLNDNGSFGADSLSELNDVDITSPQNGHFLQYDSSISKWIDSAIVPGSGSVVSVGLALPSIFTVSNSPVTVSGILTGVLNTQSANKIFAGPATGIDAIPTFRSSVADDIPATLNSTAFSGAAVSGGHSTVTVTPGAHTAVTTDIHEGINLVAHNITISGNISSLASSYIGVTTLLGSAATKTATDFYGLYVEAPVASTNAAITNGWALGLGGALKATKGVFSAGLYGAGLVSTASVGPFPIVDVANHGAGLLLQGGSNAGANNTGVAIQFYRSNVQMGSIGLDGDTGTYGGHVKAVTDLYFYTGDYGLLMDTSQNIFTKTAVSVGTVLHIGSADNTIQRNGAAASILFGAAASATPASYILTGGESSRGGTDNNIAGGSLTLQTGLGTGIGATVPMIFSVGVQVASGMTQQTRSEAFRLQAVATAVGIGFLGHAAVVAQTIGANVNNIAASGTTGQFDDFTNLSVYATDAAAIHADIYQLARSVAQLTVAMRNYGLGV